MKETTNTKKQYHYKNWIELDCNDEGTEYKITICSSQNAMKNGELSGREVLKEITLSNTEFRVLMTYLHHAYLTDSKQHLIANMYLKNRNNCDLFIKGVEWGLNKCFERLPYIPVKSNNGFIFKYNSKQHEKELLAEKYRDFSKKYRFRVILEDTRCEDKPYTAKYIRIKNDIDCKCGNCNKTRKDDCVNAFFVNTENPEMIMCDTCLGTTIGTSLTESVFIK